MFGIDIYRERRKKLQHLVKNGLIFIFGNNDSPMNYPANTYNFRQDSSFLYFFGQRRNGLIGVIDTDNDKEYLIGNDIDIDDIVWYGSVDSVADMAAQVGVSEHAPMAYLKELIGKAQASGRKIHFLPPYRHDIQIQIMDLLGIHPFNQREMASLELIHAVVELRSIKSEEEIAEIEHACSIGYQMHTTAMKLCKPGVTERYIGGVLNGVASSLGRNVSFQSIVTMHGEILHGNPSPRALESGRLLLCDAGAENNENYCSDHTRTTPISGKFTTRQREIYDIVVDCHDLALDVAKPDIRWWDVHLDVCRLMTTRLKELGLMKGNVEEAVQAGAHALFMPHGLGHMMGLDVHDMENLGQTNVGYDEETRPSDQFGLASLRFARRLQEGFILTDEPGIYFIPDLIDLWRAKGINAEFLNFDRIDTYKEFGGIRIEDDVLITKEGCRFLGKERIPYHANDVETFIEKNN